MSIFPSPLKSATAIASGERPVANVFAIKNVLALLGVEASAAAHARRASRETHRARFMRSLLRRGNPSGVRGRGEVNAESRWSGRVSSLPTLRQGRAKKDFKSTWETKISPLGSDNPE